MTLMLELPFDVQEALAQAARRQGQTPEQAALEALRRAYAPLPAVIVPPPTNSLSALFAEWDAEDATDDPEEIARRIREWEKTKANLEANRLNLEGRTDFRALLSHRSALTDAVLWRNIP